MEYLRSRFLEELNEEGDIEIRGLSWPRQQVLENMDPTGYEGLFSEWVDQEKLSAKERTKTFLDENGCLDRFKALTNRLRNGNVLPFVGAGMSIPSGFKPWGPFLLSLLADVPQLIAEVKALLDQGQYEEAAQRVHDEIGPDIFSEEIHSRLGSHRRSVAGPAILLPQIFRTEVLTTNFDYVLSNVFANASLPFTHEFCGLSLRQAQQRLGGNPHCLLRLHGEADNGDGRVLTTREYEHAYGGKPSLADILRAIIGTRSLLFMGCSLQSDRIHSALCEMKSTATIDPPRHYAFLPLPPEDQKTQRRIFLGRAEIHPIYYPPTDHNGAIEDLLISLIEGGIDD